MYTYIHLYFLLHATCACNCNGGWRRGRGGTLERRRRERNRRDGELQWGWGGKTRCKSQITTTVSGGRMQSSEFYTRRNWPSQPDLKGLACTMEDAVRVQVAADEALARALQAAGIDSNPGCSTEDDTWVIVGHSSLPSLTPPPTLTGVDGDSGSRAVAEKRKKKRKRTKSLPASSATQLLPRIRNTSLSVANYKLAKPLKYDPDLELLFSAPNLPYCCQLLVVSSRAHFAASFLSPRSDPVSSNRSASQYLYPTR